MWFDVRCTSRPAPNPWGSIELPTATLSNRLPAQTGLARKAHSPPLLRGFDPERDGLCAECLRGASGCRGPVARGSHRKGGE